jgi:hypothetical protein
LVIKNTPVLHELYVMLLILLILVVMALGGIHLVCVTPSVFAGVLALVTSLLVIRGCELYSALASIWPNEV